MKHLLLLLLIIPTGLLGQDFSLEGFGNQSGILPDDGSTIELTGYIDFTNTSDYTGDVFARWTVESQEPSSMEYKYCWNLCYPYGVTDGSQAHAVTPGLFIEHGLSDDFATQGFAGYYKSTQSGGTVIRHYFYNSTQSLQSYLDIGYCFGETSTDECDLWNSIEENAFGKVSFISATYPNPANTEARIDYHIKDMNNASYTVVNSTGSEIMTNKLNDTTGTIFIDSSELAAGFYLVNVSNNGLNIGTERLIVE